MDIERRIQSAEGLTPTEQQLADAVRSMGEKIQTCSINQFAHLTATSIASVHRFCKKLGLEGFKQLKIEVARSCAGRDRRTEAIDFDFPFDAASRAVDIAERIETLYAATLEDTRSLLDLDAMDRAAKLIKKLPALDIYTQSHNLHPAQMFCDRLLSAGKSASCHASFERQMRTALASDARRTAVAISYSGLAPNLNALLPVLARRNTPVIMIGTSRAQRLHPGLAAYLEISDRESLCHRITQFASHIAVQYALDTLFACFFAMDYKRSFAFLEESLPYTSLPGADER
ncbi:transcriptional regulator, RpiR family [Coriobacterium glomerans PW2]|uniref:Transcriptional regulator, RpiR family n=1 Tax=Coriobacterium glomerans (strain ATCC 49209 / DSM 20642 / JCM 10262 / PW2) TaxID=700015 RepID=F2N8U9_CORGP|nr:MurR/RpiR family transcriptional regulator [Coriobacterium glomerans]AEB07549.1 transcriptional regulator, RpiR family [Coriobacterium glomerans PW2]